MTHRGDPFYWLSPFTEEEREILAATRPDPQAAVVDALTEKDLDEAMPRYQRNKAPKSAGSFPLAALPAWLKRGDFKTRDNLWVAASWEQTAMEAKTLDHQRQCLAYAREAMQGGRSWHAPKSESK